MQITKYEHACVAISDNGQTVIIDPGEFSASLPLDQPNVVAVVITHIHGDHLDPAKLQHLRAHNPACAVFSTPEVAHAHPAINITTVHAGETKTVGNFTLEFFGKQHEVITTTNNTGVLINDTFYYAGDSYVLPNKPVTVLAAPASAPWLRMTEATAFVAAVHPRRFFPTHNALLSTIGEQIQYSWFERTATNIGAEFRVLAPSDSMTV